MGTRDEENGEAPEEKGTFGLLDEAFGAGVRSADFQVGLEEKKDAER